VKPADKMAALPIAPSLARYVMYDTSSFTDIDLRDLDQEAIPYMTSQQIDDIIEEHNMVD